MGISEYARLAMADQPTTPSLTMLLYLGLKRAFDVLAALVALVILSPVLLLVAIAIRLDSNGPIIYRQERVLGGQAPDMPHPERNVFTFYKFRSMHVNNDPSAHREFIQRYMEGQASTNNGTSHKPVYKLKHDPRITRVGAIIRRTSLDELPQLVNIIKGDMSWVGPRPAIPYEVEHYSPRARQRLIPQSGLTGLWQVSGRTCLTFDQMVELDIAYSQRRSAWLDLQIMIKTIPTILSRDGAW